MRKKNNGLTSVMPEEPIKEETTIEEVVEEPVVEKEKVKTFTVTAGRLNVRALAKDGSDILCVVEKGTKLTATKANKVNKKWYAVTTPSGVEGFVIDEFVE